MLTKMPQVREFMTPTPHTIGDHVSVAQAIDVFRKFGIRHLPVLKGGKVVGVLTDRDASVIQDRSDVDKWTVGDVMVTSPYCVPPETELDLVAAAMAEEKYGSVVVWDEKTHKAVGIFTAVDACRALRQVLETVIRD